MAWSKNDLAASIKRRFPHAKVENISFPSRAQMAHEAGETRKRSEEKKRLEGEYGRYDKSKPKHSVHISDGSHWTLNVGQAELSIPKSDAKHNAPSFWNKKKCAGCLKPVFKHAWHEERKLWMCTKCRHKAGFFHAHEVREEGKYRRMIQGVTQRRGNGDILNENISGQMLQHGHPESIAAMKKAGAIQTRRDQNGNPCHYFVASSRKKQAELIKQFNRRQIEARDRGWSGTTREGTKSTWLVAHGGNSMGD